MKKFQVHEYLYEWNDGERERDQRIWWISYHVYKSGQLVQLLLFIEYNSFSNSVKQLSHIDEMNVVCITSMRGKQMILCIFVNLIDFDVIYFFF